MVAYISQIPFGNPGDIARGNHDNTILPMIRDLTNPKIWEDYAFGLPVKRSAADRGKILPFSGGETATDYAGFLVRSYPGYAVDRISADQNSPDTRHAPAGVMRRGFTLVKVQNISSADAGVPVFVRIGGATPELKIGGIEAAADGENTVMLPNVYFSGKADVNGVAGIEVNL